MISPDEVSCGFVEALPKANRYESASESPWDTPRLIAGCIPRGARVLDIGCGTGSTAVVYQKYSGCEVLGVEPDPQRAEAARASGLKAITGYYTAEVGREHGPFDVIVFADVVEHLANPAALLTEARKALKPGGILLVSLPNVAHWSVRSGLLRGRFDYAPTGIMDATHLRWFTLDSATRFFQNLGFEVTYVKSTVNAALPHYQHRLPWRWIPYSIRRRLLTPLTMALPRLFGCQHIFTLRQPAGKA